MVMDNAVELFWKVISTSLLGIVILMLSACGGGDDFSDLEAEMEAIKRRPSGKIQEPPHFKTFENFSYSASLLRSPFQPPIEAEPVILVLQGKKVRPDLNRARELLEEFSIESLLMVGTIRMVDNSLYALIQDNRGNIHKVTNGNFMGKNHGKISKLTTQQIDLVELIPDGVGEWVERPRTIVMKTQE